MTFDSVSFSPCNGNFSERIKFKVGPVTIISNPYKSISNNAKLCPS